LLFPQNPKILVIDDEYNEVKGLLSALSKNGTPYAYFDGSFDSEPDEPFAGVRLVIMDIDLANRPSGTGDKNKAAVLTTYLKKLISVSANPLFVLFWTKNTALIKLVINNLEKEKIFLSGYVDLEKPSAIDMGKMKIEDFEEKITSVVSKNAFNYIIGWENGIDKAVSLFTNEISAVCKSDSENSKSDWNKSVMSVLSKLACSYIGLDKLNGIESKKKLLYATYVLNKSFSENLPTIVDVKSDIDLPVENKLSLRTIAGLNTKLFLKNVSDLNRIENGKIFEDVENTELLNLLEKEKKIAGLSKNGNTKLVSIILTPPCDIAHTKFLKKDDKVEMHRVLYGVKIVIPDDDPSILDCLKSSIPETLYFVRPFIDKDNKVCIIVFHFGTITTKPLKTGEVSFSYMLKENLTFDLQTKLANHVNRLGNSMLEC
jgi:hypothetical protein